MGTCPLGLFRTALRSTLRTKAEVKSDFTVQSVLSLVRLHVDRIGKKHMHVGQALT